MAKTSSVPRKLRCGIDTGGTFTDLIGINSATGELVVAKFPSSAKDPVTSITGVIRESGLDLNQVASMVLATTLGLNALLQRQGASVIFLTTAGFEDVLFIQRMNRRYHYSFEWLKPTPLVERRNCLGVRERIDAQGKVLLALDCSDLERIAGEIERRRQDDPGRPLAIAVCLLFAYLNPRHERLLADHLKSRFPTVPVSVSHEVAPIWREYERSSTTVVDAFIKPILGHYVAGVRSSFEQLGRSVPWTIIKSNGGHATPAAVEKQPVNTVLSGLSGGIIGGRYFGNLAGQNNLVTLDMGGTSCDVGLVRDGAFSQVMNYEVEWGMPISAPFVDVTSIGAGGGSTARVDKGGFLRVGPHSAGADPGPACYGQGGNEATVTDANLVLGRLNPDFFLGGKIKLCAEKAERAVSQIGKQLGLDCTGAAQAIIDVADENMANAIRVISVERGLDPREFTLVSFGGAGPLHTGGIADKIGMKRIVVPLYPGLCSAFGTLIADFQVDKMLSLHLRSSNADPGRIERIFRAMVQSAAQELKEEGYAGVPRIERILSMRYAGQNYEHEVRVGPEPVTRPRLEALFERFHQMHERFYGYSISREVIEIIRFAVRAVGPLQLPRLKTIPRSRMSRPKQKRKVHFKDAGYVTCPVYARSSLPSGARLMGPAIIEEEDSTILLHPRNKSQVNHQGVITITL